MDAALPTLFSSTKLKPRYDDDFVDRLNRRYSVVLLMAFMAIISGAQYVGKPIHCWCPKQYTGEMVQFATRTCWVKNTYYIPEDMRIPDGDLKPYEISYYQWIPFILVAQAMLFYTPSIIWGAIIRKTGFDLSSLIEKVNKGNTKEKDHKKYTELALFQFDRYLRARDKKQEVKPNSKCRIGCWSNLMKSCGGPIVVGYFAIKLLYILNVIGQIFLLGIFFGKGFHTFGIDVATRWMESGDFLRSGVFPLRTLCQFDVRLHRILQTHRFECVLPINLFNETIYIFMWFWLLIITIVTIINFLRWLYFMMFTSNRREMVSKAVLDDESDQEKLEKFTDVYLARDGVFMLRMMAKNAGSLATSDVIMELWKDYDPPKRIANGDPYNAETLPPYNTIDTMPSKFKYNVN